MKFPKPRELKINEYPDLALSQPELFKKMISQIVYPKDKTEYGLFVENSIKFMKEAARAKNKTVKINSVALNRQLYFTRINNVSQYFQNCYDIYGLVDTGAANLLIQQNIAKKLGLVCTPFKCTLSTATGTDDEAITGITHTEFTLQTKKGVHMKLCTDFIVSNVLTLFGTGSFTYTKVRGLFSANNPVNDDLKSPPLRLQKQKIYTKVRPRPYSTWDGWQKNYSQIESCEMNQWLL
jgi:hypothetical protein